jgi:hypothetical protein
MAKIKIDQDAFDKISGSANLKNKQDDNSETVRNTSVYEIPRAWIDAIKNNKISVSSYIKQAMFEKLKRDGMV